MKQNGKPLNNIKPEFFGIFQTEEVRTWAPAKIRAFFDHVDALDEVAKNTYRLTFGQLWSVWVHDQSLTPIDIILKAFYIEPIIEQLNQPSVLWSKIHEQSHSG